MIRTFYLTLLVMGIVLAVGCERPAEPEQKAPTPTQTTQKTMAPVKTVEKTTSKAELAKADVSPVDHYNEMVKIRKSRPLNVETFVSSYVQVPSLVSYVKAADERYATQLDRRIRMALKKVQGGADLYPDAQMAEKTVQRAFLLTFFKSLEQLTSEPTNNKAQTLMLDAAPVVRNTTARRSEWAGKGSEYADRFDLTMKNYSNAVEKKLSGDIQKAAGDFKALAVKTLVLSIFYELTGLETSRGKNDSKAREKLTEALVYFESLMDEHKSRNSDGASIVMAQLSQTTDNVDLELVKTIMKQDFKDEIQDVTPKTLGL